MTDALIAHETDDGVDLVEGFVASLHLTMEWVIDRVRVILEMNAIQATQFVHHLPGYLPGEKELVVGYFF